MCARKNTDTKYKFYWLRRPQETNKNASSACLLTVHTFFASLEATRCAAQDMKLKETYLLVVLQICPFSEVTAWQYFSVHWMLDLLQSWCSFRLLSAKPHLYREDKLTALHIVHIRNSIHWHCTRNITRGQKPNTSRYMQPGDTLQEKKMYKQARGGWYACFCGSLVH